MKMQRNTKVNTAPGKRATKKLTLLAQAQSSEQITRRACCGLKFWPAQKAQHAMQFGVAAGT